MSQVTGKVIVLRCDVDGCTSRADFLMSDELQETGWLELRKLGDGPTDRKRHVCPDCADVLGIEWGHGFGDRQLTADNSPRFQTLATVAAMNAIDPRNINAALVKKALPESTNASNAIDVTPEKPKGLRERILRKVHNDAIR